MLDALADAPGWLLDLVGPVAAEDATWVATWQATSPARDRVRWHGRQPPQRAWRVAAGAWAGACLLEDTPAFRAAMPSKVFEYLAAGLPVLASPRPRMADVVRRSGAGAVVEGADQAAATLREWTADASVLDRMAGAARAWWASGEAGTAEYRELATRVADLSGRSGRPEAVR
jgi:glycosyltransferase involved in cell wall biosynthesis